MQTSKSAALLRRGSQTPTKSVVPDYTHTDGPDAVDLAAGYGLNLDEWQQLVLGDWLGRNKFGKFASRVLGLAVPRQNGKNAILEVREVFGMVFLGERILHTAHEVKTARKAFLRLLSFFEQEYPEMVALVKTIRKTNGQEGIELKNGGSIEFVARSRGSARGYSVDVIVLDEAQELGDEHMEALMPTLSASPDYQLIMCGTPPQDFTMGEVFRSNRTKALEGIIGTYCWHEWSVSGIGDTSDRRRWYETNPALGIRITEEYVESEFAALSVDGFARERLGWWSEAYAGSAAIPADKWQACGIDVVYPGTVSYGVKFDPDGTHVTLAVASKPAKALGEKIHVEVIEHRNTGGGTSWLSDWLAARADKAALIAIDGRSGVDALKNRLIELGVSDKTIMTVGTKDMIAASSVFLEAVREGTLTHFDQEILNASVRFATKRKIGKEGGFGFQSMVAEIDVTILEAVAVAHYAAKTTKRRPGRKAKVI